MPVEQDGHLAFADAKAARVGAISLHNAAPATAANEVTGGGYNRQVPIYDPATWDANGNVARASITAPLAFTGPPDDPVAAVGWWSNDAEPVLLGSDDTVEGDAAFSAGGEYTVTQADITD